MLATIIADFLKINEKHANSLLKLLMLEKRFQQQFTYKNENINPADIKTQADLIMFLQSVGQSKWFQGHDRSAFTQISDEQANQIYYALFAAMGLTKQRSVTDELKETPPDVLVVPGSTEQQVKCRLQHLNNDIQKGIFPSTGYVVGLGCNRVLGKIPLDKEQDTIDKLTQRNLAPTEANLVDLQTTQTLENFPNLTYVGINTAANTVNVSDSKARATTADTAVSLKSWLEKNVGKNLLLAVYSNSPFISRQTLDMQLQLGDDYKVMGVGPGLPVSLFEKHLQNKVPAVNICLGEIARLTNTSFVNLSAEKRVEYARTALTEGELAELAHLLQTPNLSTAEQDALLNQYQITKATETLFGDTSLSLWKPVFAKETSNVPEEMVGFGTKAGAAFMS